MEDQSKAVDDTCTAERTVAERNAEYARKRVLREVDIRIFNPHKREPYRLIVRCTLEYLATAPFLTPVGIYDAREIERATPFPRNMLDEFSDAEVRMIRMECTDEYINEGRWNDGKRTSRS